MQPKLRSSSQILPEVLAVYLEVKSESVLIDNRLKTLEVDPPEQTEAEIRANIALTEKDQSYSFACLQSIEKSSSELHGFIMDWIVSRVGTVDDFLKLQEPKH